MDLKCIHCGTAIQPDWYFCPNCGKAVKEKPLSISIGKQLLIYSVSFFLTPFGLGWGIQYLKSPDIKRKIVGFIAVLLTIISIVLMIVAFKDFMDQYSKLLDNYGVLK